MACNYPPVTHVLRPHRSSIFLIGLIGGLVLLAITLIPASIPLSASQPGLPIRAGFFYPWFPNAWTQNNIYPYTNFSPALGYYSSSDDAIIDQQLRLAAQAHLDAFISSWWGPGHHTDSALQHILERSERPGSPNPDLRWAIYYEAESYSDPSAAQIAADLQYLETNVFSHPSFLRVNGLPVVFVYASATDGTNMAARWAQAKALYPSVYVVLKVYAGYQTDPNQPDSWHQYGPAAAYDAQLPYSVSVSPGFWKVGEAPRLTRDPLRFESDIQRMVTSGATWQLVTAWNEWGEGTSIEPAVEFGTTYIDILCRNLPGSVPCDSDHDGFEDVLETFMGTLPYVACPATSIGGDEDPDAWPSDADDDRDVDTGDVLALFYGKIGNPPAYTPRSDFNADGDIDIGDVIIGFSFKAQISNTCTPTPTP